jgi:hypothetical protein
MFYEYGRKYTIAKNRHGILLAWIPFQPLF